MLSFKDLAFDSEVSFQLEKVKMLPDIPFVLPKSYTKLAKEKLPVPDNTQLVKCQVRPYK